MSELVTIGKFISPFGLKGEVKVFPYSDFPERCKLLREITVQGESGSETRLVKEARVYKNLWIIHLEGCDSREDAALLNGSLLKIPAAERIPLPEGSYYFDELIGLAAVGTGGEKLGEVRDILQAGGNDVYVIKREPVDEGPANEILVPAVRSVVKEINLQEGYMLLDLPEGLLD